MKYSISGLIMFFFLFISCSKNESTPTPSATPLIKSMILITHVPVTGESRAERFDFDYDGQTRLSDYVDSGTGGSFYSKHNFFYIGNSSIPDHYTVYYNSPHGGPYNEEHLLITNAQNQILEDSITATNTLDSNGNRYYSYSDGLVTLTKGYYNNGMGTVNKLGIDSFLIDASNNLIEMIYGSNPTSYQPANTYQRNGMIKYTYGNILSPFYATPASIFTFVRGSIESKYYPVKLEQFKDLSDVSSLQYNYQYITDSQSRVSMIISNSGDSTLFTYY